MRISDWSSDVCSSDLVPAHRFVNQFERIAAILDSLIKCCNRRAKQPHELPHRLNTIVVATPAPTPRAPGHAPDQPVKPLARRLGKSGLNVAHCGPRRRPPAIDAIPPNNESRSQPAPPTQIGNSAYQTGPPNPP